MENVRTINEIFNLKKIGEACRKIREREGYKIVEFARLTGYSEANIRKFEKGENNNLCIFLYYIEFSITGRNNNNEETSKQQLNKFI